jgi:amidohydrolase
MKPGVEKGPAMESDWKNALDHEMDQGFTEMISIRRHLHTCPEVSGLETRTTQFLKDLLVGRGLEVRVAPDGCGLIAEPKDQDPGPRIALRADMDALRIQDLKMVAYRSQVPGVMHACGHDAHTALVMGAITGLVRAGAAGIFPWPVRWRGILQPAEEIATGATNMIAAGALENVEAIFAVHVDPSLDVGKIGLRTGVMTAACDWLEVRIAGRGGHAARPHESRDPIAAAAQMVTSMYLFVPRNAADPGRGRAPADQGSHPAVGPGHRRNIRHLD